MADLYSAGHRRGVVGAPHGAAVEAGRAILAEGGNAVEAMVAMAATIVAVYPHMNHLGGGGFWLFRERTGRGGYQVTRSQKQLTENHLAELKDVPGFAAAFLVDGKVPAVGTTLKQQALAATLEQLAHAGLDDFYRGDIAREIAADLERIGSPVTREDLTRYEAKIAEPLRADLSSGTVYNTGAPTQGIASLLILALFDRLGVTVGEGFDHIHGLVEATKCAIRARDRAVTDPNFLAHPLGRYLEPR